MSSFVTSGMQNIHVTGLCNQHAVENHAFERLERQAGGLENYPEMADGTRRHIDESREQAHWLDGLLSHFDASASSLEDTKLPVIGSMAAWISDHLGSTTGPLLRISPSQQSGV